MNCSERHLLSRGFTLLEVMVALAIAATALVALMGRVGSSADIQHDLSMHAEALSLAVNQLESLRLEKAPVAEREGEVETGRGVFHWQLTLEKTLDDGFVRQNMLVTAPDGGEVRMFLYRNIP
ncbi:MAG: type II secretion system minor pseudopilin GspI [Mariprofundaceae bacterium]